MTRFVTTGRLLVLALVGVAAVMGACTGSKIRKVNVSGGEYYAQDELEMMSAGRRNAYCDALEAERAIAQADLDAKETEIEETRELIASIRQQIVPLETEVRRLESDIRSLNDQIDLVKALPQEWVVRPGESLTAIAMHEQVYNDIDKWEVIWRANEDKIFDPYYIFPDTVLVIPRNFPTD